MSSAKPRVIFVTTVFQDGSTGPAVYAKYLWQTLKDDPSIEFHIVAPTAVEKHPRLHTVGRGNHSMDLCMRVQRRALELASGCEAETIAHGNASHSMWRFIKYPGPWLVQVNDYDVATILKRPLRILVSCGLRRLISLIWRHHVESMVIRSATHIVCNSHYTRQKVLECYNVPRPDRLLTIYKAVDTATFRRPSSLPLDPFPWRPKGARLVFVGSDWRRKGLQDLIEAIGHIVKKIPHVHLTVAGHCDPGSPGHFCSLANQAGIEARISFVGPLDSDCLAAAFFHSDVFVLPSLDEAFGVAVLEALSAGLPVVTTNVGGIAEIVSDDYAMICRAGDPHHLAKSLVELLMNRSRLEALSITGPLRAARFGVEVMIENVRKLYIALAKSS